MLSKDGAGVKVSQEKQNCSQRRYFEEEKPS